jgi:hypothetical protein
VSTENKNQPDLLRELIGLLADALFERLAAAQGGAKAPPLEADGTEPPGPRVYTDREVCEILDIGSTTLWKIRDKQGLLRSGYLFPGSRERRTTPKQLADYFAYLESSAAAEGREGDEDGEDEGLDERLDELSARRRRRRVV